MLWLDLGYRKVLKRVRNSSCSAIPLGSWAAGESRMVRRTEARKQLFPRPAFIEVSRIGVDGRNAEVLAGNLSPLGKLFEIYFVRLIGTPNQKSKWMPAPVGIKLVVQKNH
jgi:hypothetical protein